MSDQPTAAHGPGDVVDGSKCGVEHPTSLPWRCTCGKEPGHVETGDYDSAVHKCAGCGFEWGAGDPLSTDAVDLEACRRNAYAWALDNQIRAGKGDQAATIAAHIVDSMSDVELADQFRTAVERLAAIPDQTAAIGAAFLETAGNGPSPDETVAAFRDRMRKLARLRDQVTSGIKVIGPIEPGSLILFPEAMFTEPGDQDDEAGERLYEAATAIAKMLGHSKFTCATYTPGDPPVMVLGKEAVRDMVRGLMTELGVHAHMDG